MKILSACVGMLLLVVAVGIDAHALDDEARGGALQVQADVTIVDKVPVLHISTQPESFVALISESGLLLLSKESKSIFYLPSEYGKSRRMVYAGKAAVNLRGDEKATDILFNKQGIIQDGGGNDILIKSFSEVSGLVAEITYASLSIKLENIDVEIFDGMTRITDGVTKIEKKIGFLPPTPSDLGLELTTGPQMLRILRDNGELTKLTYFKDSSAIAEKTNISYPTLCNIVGTKLPALIVDRDAMDIVLLKTTVGEIVVGEEPDPKSLELSGKITIGTGDIKIRLIDSDAGTVEALDRGFQLQLMRSSIGGF